MTPHSLLSLILLSALWPWTAKAEYRVFLLKITRQPAAVSPVASDTAAASPTQDNGEGEQDFRLAESTLDPIQYRLYYPVAKDEVVTYIDTWRCYGRTDDFKNFCPNPKGQIPPAPATAP